ncbi:MAG: 3-hydroxybutyrate dehydrogenase [Marinicella pacifica]
MNKKAKQVLITGASGGIGLAIGRHLAKENQVILSDYNLNSLTETQQQLKQQGLDVDIMQLDVCNDNHLTALKARAENKGIDVLVNNAGIQYVSPLEEFPREKWQQLINVMLMGPAMTTQAVLPSMKANNFGRIINIGSVHSLVASAYKSAYISAKHGLLGLAKTLALEVADFDITINTLCPGYVDTAMVRDQISQQAKAHGISEDEVVEKIMLKHMPKKQFVSVEELAGTAAFLISPAARNITAQAIALDGGWTAQ